VIVDVSLAKMPVALVIFVLILASGWLILLQAHFYTNKELFLSIKFKERENFPTIIEISSLSGKIICPFNE
jgi:hypothetical protein